MRFKPAVLALAVVALCACSDVPPSAPVGYTEPSTPVVTPVADTITMGSSQRAR